MRKCGLELNIISYDQVVDDLSKALLDLLNNPEKINLLSHGVNNCIDNFTWEKRRNLFNQFYNIAIENWKMKKSISMKKEIICFHFLNNYSGSPFILSLVIRALIDEGHRVTLYTSKGKGFLSDNPDIKYKFLMYEWKLNKIWLSFLFILTQLQLFFSVLLNHSFKKNQIFYINTILPLEQHLQAGC
ncbi:MAG: hypothetical protein IPI19_09475 [Ignavibacteriales bacterium]|nr:hypothetical protein [Ignavibacteriales bacterium]